MVQMKNNLKIKDLVKDLEALITKEYDEYTALHEELNKFRGVKLTDEQIPQVNELLKKIQSKFSELYPAYNYIGQRYQHAVNATNDYNKFVEDIKKAGASQDKKQPKDEKTEDGSHGENGK